MAAEISVSQLEAEIKKIYIAVPADAKKRIQSHLNRRLGSLPLTERITLLEQVAVQFDPNASPAMPPSPVQQDILSNLFLLLLGEKTSHLEMQSEKQLERLADALNTIFDSLNELIDVINTSLKGNASQQETIRGIIGMRLSNQVETVSLGEHLGQIKQAFLLSREAMTDAARSMVGEILAELDPERLESERKTTRFGPFRKAELLDISNKKHQRCRRWFESDQFENKLLREFEKQCLKHFES